MKPFEGITVLDFTQFTSGPVATYILADMGAEVIKIENPPYGEFNRYITPSKNHKSSYITSLNHNKKSILMNMKDAEQRALFYKMVETADIVIDNFKAGTMKKFGCDYETLKQINPKIICASISGFGQYGPWSNRAAYDMIIQGASGLMSITGEKGGRPVACGVSIADFSTGLTCAVALTAAIYDVKRTGTGRCIDIAMLDSVVALIEQAVARYGVTGESPKPLGNEHPGSVPFNDFMCRDGKSIVICIYSDAEFARFCKLLGHEDLLETTSYASSAQRTKNREDVNRIIASYIREWDFADLSAKMEEAGLTYSQLNTIADICQLQHTAERNMLVKSTWPDGTSMTIPGNPIKISGVEEETEYQVVPLGYNTIEVLSRYADPAEVHRIFDPVIEESNRLYEEKTSVLP